MAAIDPRIIEAQADFTQHISGDWALVSAGTLADFNTMTIGWGSAGVLWGKPIVSVFVHPNRHTHAYLEANDYFTVQLFDEAHKRDLAILGAKSGRDTDKVALTSLTPTAIDASVGFEEARLTLVMKKILTHHMVPIDAPVDFLVSHMDGLYAEKAHTIFMGEITGLIRR